jgi:hypothetical protein
MLGVDLDAREVLDATGGWVAGVMFEAWRSSDREAAEGGFADPLLGYLARNMFGQLTDGERELLLVTSVLRDVTADRAGALGIVDAGPRLELLRERHLPATHALYAGGFAPSPEIRASSESQIDAIQQALAPWATRYLNPNFVETKHAPESLWTEPALQRLRWIKATVDPDDAIRSNHPVQPRH